MAFYDSRLARKPRAAHKATPGHLGRITANLSACFDPLLNRRASSGAKPRAKFFVNEKPPLTGARLTAGIGRQRLFNVFNGALYDTTKSRIAHTLTPCHDTLSKYHASSSNSESSNTTSLAAPQVPLMRHGRYASIASVGAFAVATTRCNAP